MHMRAREPQAVSREIIYGPIIISEGDGENARGEPPAHGRRGYGEFARRVGI